MSVNRGRSFRRLPQFGSAQTSAGMAPRLERIGFDESLDGVEGDPTRHEHNPRSCCTTTNRYSGRIVGESGSRCLIVA